MLVSGLAVLSAYADLVANTCTQLVGGGERVDLQSSQARQVGVGLVETEWFVHGGEVSENVVKLRGDLFVTGEAAREDDEIGAKSTRHDTRHGGVHATSAGFVTGRRDDPPIARTSDRDWEAPQGGIVKNLHRREKGVEVHVENGIVVDRCVNGRCRHSEMPHRSAR